MDFSKALTPQDKQPKSPRRPDFHLTREIPAVGVLKKNPRIFLAFLTEWPAKFGLNGIHPFQVVYRRFLHEHDHQFPQSS